MAAISITGWPEGHPHLTKLDNYPFGIPHLTCRNPLNDNEQDGYAASFRSLYNRYKRRAAKGGLAFTLTEKDFFELTSQPCCYCAAPPSRKASNKVKSPYLYNGLDRVDCSKGYIHSNCWACCWTHNDLKGKLTFVDLYRHSLAVVLSVSSMTALDIGDLECLDRLIDLFPNVLFLKKHREALLEDIETKRVTPLRFNWKLQPVLPQG